MKKTHDVVFWAGKYTNAQGEEKNRYINCGAVLRDEENGRSKILLNSLPVGVATDRGGIWLDLYAATPNKPKPQAAAPMNAPLDDEIPF